MTTACERLAEWAVSLRLEDVPERVRQKARYQVLNVIAALHAGAATAPGRQVREAVTGWGRAGPCTVIPTGERLGLHDAVLVTGAYSMALDYDDYLYLGHTGHSAVLGALSLCEERRLTGAELLAAQVVANEIGGRLGASALLGPQNGQTWSFLHAAGAAAIGARLLGLSPRQAAHALAIALYQPPFTLWPGFMGPGSKALTAAVPTVTGLQAAAFARAGMTGALDIVESPQGFWSAFSYAPLPHMLTGLGQAWVTDSIAFKKHPGCAYVSTVLDALEAIGAAYRAARGVPLGPAAIADVHVEANLLTVEMDNLAAGTASDGPPGAVETNFSVPLSVAVALHAGRLGAAELRPEHLLAHAAEIRALAARVHVTHDWAMSLLVAERLDAALGENGALAALSARDVAATLGGLRHRLRGRHRTSLSPFRLLGQGRALASLLASRIRSPTSRPPPDLARVDFATLRMTFPVRVTVTTVDGERLVERRDVPAGAPGDPAIFDVVEDKLRREAAARLPAERIERLIGLVRALEGVPVAELVAAASWPSA